LPLLGWIVLFTAVGGIASAAFAGLFLLLPEKTGLRMLPHFVSFATGALIGAALLGLLPEAMQSVGPGGAHAIGVALVIGLGVFFIIEKLVLWRHAHSHEHEDPTEREVAAHGVTDTLAHDDGAEGHGVKALTAGHPAQNVAFAGNVGGQPAISGGALLQSHVAELAGHGGHDHGQDPGNERGHDHAHLGAGHGHDRDQGHNQGHHGDGHGEGRGHSPGAQDEDHGGRDQGHNSAGHDHGHNQDRGHNPVGRNAAAHDHGRHDQGRDHGGHDHGRDGAAGVLVLIGDSIHNALDGILIAAAFLTNVPLGLVTTLAVAAHEIPHRVGDFALLLHAGMSRKRAMFLNMATGLASVLGGIVAYFGLSKAQDALPYALALAAAGFLYIAVAGLIPGLHRRADPRTSLAQVVLMGLGVGVIAWAELLTR
jgi:zinc transporter ZupT